MIVYFLLYNHIKINYYKILLQSYINQDLFYLDDLEILKSYLYDFVVLHRYIYYFFVNIFIFF